MFFPSTEDKTREIAHTFAQLLKPGDIVCLDGDLGAGKTTFVKGIATRFNNNMDDVTSPTFVYLNIYDQLAHFDLYRIIDINLDGFVTKEEVINGLDKLIEAP